MPKRKKPEKMEFEEMEDGESTRVTLRHYKADRNPRAILHLECCDCGLKHLHDIEVDLENDELYIRIHRLN